jgi:hypothetical protein
MFFPYFIRDFDSEQIVAALDYKQTQREGRALRGVLGDIRSSYQIQLWLLSRSAAKLVHG